MDPETFWWGFNDIGRDHSDSGDYYPDDFDDRDDFWDEDFVDD